VIESRDLTVCNRQADKVAKECKKHACCCEVEYTHMTKMMIVLPTSRPSQIVEIVFKSRDVRDQMELKNGLPFAVNAHAADDGHLPHVPNAETLAAIREKPGRRFSAPEAFLADRKS
jgi:hypothetical protein